MRSNVSRALNAWRDEAERITRPLKQTPDEFRTANGGLFTKRKSASISSCASDSRNASGDVPVDIASRVFKPSSSEAASVDVA